MSLTAAWPALLLYSMATLDSFLVGFRVAAGRNLAIKKRAYFLAAMRRSFWLGQALLALSALVATLVLQLTPDPGETWRHFLIAAQNLLWAYAPYSVLVLVALGFYLIPKHDSRAIATVVILGPFTLLRPYVFLFGLAICWWQTREVVPCMIASFGVALQLGLEPVLEMRRKRRKSGDSVRA
ncbi:MAG: hypothetical protein H6718_04945 [Polyangiaceae bacterium]|nr:hypothetical protein [Myxococcales bacterium]MCB9584718.1 hypothetical protein [Polyangiaceae bacterium]MCB9607709.1 hypothetical protein [Polyangiaceae bacterium]